MNIRDFGPSWRDGRAFHSMIHTINPSLVDIDKVKASSNKENLEAAFSIAQHDLGIPRLLEPEGE